VKRKKITGGELRSKLINYIYDHDGETNAFPSGHVYGSLLMTYYLVEAGFGWWWYVIGIAVSLSTLFVKQHYIVDIFGGLLWVIVGIWLGTFF
jgi:membrane-associated phospholipid phosphatase